MKSEETLQTRELIQMEKDGFKYMDERFADIQVLRYRLNGFEELSLRQKIYIYYLSEATLYGRDIVFDQFGKYNLRIRKMLEAIFVTQHLIEESDEKKAFETYLKQVWFSNGIYHHYGYEKIIPTFTPEFLRNALEKVDEKSLPLREGQTLQEFCEELFPVIFNPTILPKRVNQADGEDLVLTSACNYYENVNQQEVEQYYARKAEREYARRQAREKGGTPSWGLNSKLVKEDNGILKEHVWKENGMYGAAIKKIISCLDKAGEYTENDRQRHLIQLLIEYYQTGDLRQFDKYSIEWVHENEGEIDFINGFIEVYGDPLGLKASWEGIVEYRDTIATKRTQTISQNAQWFEDHSPIDEQFKKKEVRGITARAVCAAMLGGDEYPSTAIGINLPNAEWIRAQYGSKSVTITNITEAYSKAAHGNGFYEEFVADDQMRALIARYGDLCDALHTDLHECLGHGSGQLLANTDPDALKNYGSTIEEARADLFGLYYIADPKLVELGLLPCAEAHHAQYYTYMMNGLLTQLTRIQPGKQLEEAHMRNRALIAHWVKEHANGAVALEKVSGKTVVCISDYQELRKIIAQLLREIQRIKSEGDYATARYLVETYGVRIDGELHKEVLLRYEKLHLAPYKGFINPVLIPIYNEEGGISDIKVDYSESYTSQMLRYSKDYATL